MVELRYPGFYPVTVQASERFADAPAVAERLARDRTLAGIPDNEPELRWLLDRTFSHEGPLEVEFNENGDCLFTAPLDGFWFNEVHKTYPEFIGLIGKTILGVVHSYTPHTEIDGFRGELMTHKARTEMNVTLAEYERLLVALGAPTAVQSMRTRLGLVS